MGELSRQEMSDWLSAALCMLRKLEWCGEVHRWEDGGRCINCGSPEPKHLANCGLDAILNKETPDGLN